MKAVVLAAATALTLSACTMSAKGLAESNLDMTVVSTKSTQAFATCAAEAMIGAPQLRNEGDHYWILRTNMYGIPISRWDFKSTASGSVAELRSTLGMNTGDERVKACA